MRKAIGSMVAVGFAVANASAANLNLTVRQAGTGLSSITVAPGAVVNYEIVGVLSDTNNGGLALWGADLDFSGADLSAATLPVADPMANFVPPDGISNPDTPCPPACGYAGTIIGGNLVQIGGGQNTINNTALNAPFPIGTVIENVGHSAVVLITGSLTAPVTEAVYTLSIPTSSVFGNVIKAGEDGTPFWATEAFGVGTITNMTIEVAAGGVSLVSTDPACEDTLPRSTNHTMRLTFDGAIVAPNATQIEIVALQAGGAVGANLAANFTMTVEPGNVLRIRDNGNHLTNNAWVGIRNVGNWPGVSNFEVDYAVAVGDADNSGVTNFFDLNVVFGGIGAATDTDRRDMDGSAVVNFFDINLAFGGVGSFAPAKPGGHNCTLIP